MSDLSLISVVMAGGTGSRLWPMSRVLRPKQFLSLYSDKSMLQETIARANACGAVESIVICNEEHRFLAAEQLREINQPGKIILEPEGRNTAPAIALAALDIIKNYGDALMLVLAADHVIQNVESFVRSVDHALSHAVDTAMVTFGIVPTHAETGYGYIKRGDALKTGYKIDTFVEKPSQNIAEEYVSSGDYYWNSGMFLFKASSYLEELERFHPQIYATCVQAMDALDVDQDFLRVDKAVFMSCPADSVDYAVMEHTDKGVVIPLDSHWSDLGAWSALSNISKKDDNGNVTRGDVVQISTKSSYISAESRLVATVGVQDLVVVETSDAVLVAHKDSTQDVKKIVEELKKTERGEYYCHREVFRPWGKYDSIDKGGRYQVKRITVSPGEKLSLQKHHHRSEHWIVVAGTAQVTVGDKIVLVAENESIYIPLGVNHALENPGKIPLEIIEVQTGSYLGEDDIVRFEDRYGRS